MSDSGSGVGTPLTLVPIPQPVYDQFEELSDRGNCAVPLHRYAQLINYDEYAFWGLRYDDQEEYACNNFWSEPDRMNVAYALAEAQADMENIMGFPLCPTWVTGNWQNGAGDGRFTDSQPYYRHQVTRYGYVIAPGVRAEQMLAEDAAVEYGFDPAVIGPIATTVTNVQEIQVFYPNSTRRVYPSKIVIDSGFVTVYIPRCRLVADGLLNDTDVLDADVLENFQPTVDVKRVYNDNSTQAQLVAMHSCSPACLSTGCSRYTQSACIVFKDYRLGFAQVVPATYANNTWTIAGASLCNRHYSRVELNYYAGLQSLSRDIEMAIVRLAHTKLGLPPCSCDHYAALWRADRETPRGTMTRSLQNAPFGTMVGAQYAFNVAKRLKIHRAGGIF